MDMNKCDNLRWTFNLVGRNEISRGLLGGTLLQLPWRVLRESSNQAEIMTEDILHILWNIEAAFLGNIPNALSGFENRILPRAIETKSDLSWQLYCLAMISILRIYIGDSNGALSHIQEASNITKQYEPVLSLIESIALRIHGDTEKAFRIASATLKHEDSDYIVCKNCDALIKEISIRNKLEGFMNGIDSYHRNNYYPENRGYVLIAAALLRAKATGALPDSSEYDVRNIRIKPYEYILLQTLLEDCLEEPLQLVELTDKPWGNNW